jgi:hypothetical protein
MPNLSITPKRLVYTAIAVGLIALAIGSQKKVAAQVADDLTPGMLFGPLNVSDNQHIELCASYLSEGTIKATVHFRNLTTGEVTAGQTVTVPSGGGACVSYQGKGNVVGLARGDGAASDWVSPSNALISSMSVMDDVYLPTTGGLKSTVRTSVLGVAKIWVKGL